MEYRNVRLSLNAVLSSVLSSTGAHAKRILNSLVVALVSSALIAGCGGGSNKTSTAAAASGPTIASQPASVSLAEGDSTTLKVVASGATAYQWKKNGVDIVGATTDTLSVVANAVDNQAKYTVVVSAGSASVTSATAVLTIKASPITITAQPDAQVEAAAGQSVTLSVTAMGTGPLTYQWRKNAVAITGATSDTFTIASADVADNGAQYSVQVGNAMGRVLSDTSILVVTDIPRPPVFTKDLVDFTPATDGLAAVFLTAVRSTNAATFQWFSDDVAIKGATTASYTTAALTAKDEGRRFWVVATNSEGSTTSKTTTIKVSAKPSITTQPANVSAVTGATATFNVVAGGSGPLTYQWSVQGKAITGATSASYTTKVLALSDNNTVYTVKVTNAMGSDLSKAAMLTVTAAPTFPVIGTQPTSATVRPGATASFTVSASGAQPLSYQWSRNGVAISGATSDTYTTTATAEDDGAAFIVTITNSTTKTATSNRAILTVIPEVTSIATGSFDSFAVGSDGSVLGWGSSTSGQLTARTTGVAPGVPVKAKGSSGAVFTNVNKIAAGTNHVIALLKDGSVWGWGDGNYGTLGDYALNAHIAYAPAEVREVTGVPLTGVSEVSAGAYFTVALKTDGTVRTWGYNRYGKLGDGTVANRANPGQVLMAGGTTMTGVSKVAAGGDHACAVQATKVYCWGDNSGGDLGNGTLSWSGVPVKVEKDPGVELDGIVDLAAGLSHTLALTADGKAYAWGANTSGSLGDGTVNRRTRAIPVLNADGSVLTGIASIAAGQNTSAFLMLDGTVLVVGDNSYGQGGASTAGQGFQLRPKPVTLLAGGPPMNDIKLLSMTFAHVMVKRGDGSIWTWGYDNSYQLGNPSRTSSIQPNPTKVNGV